MELNFTLFVQAAHFLCAYGLLRMLFFSPALKIIAQEEQDKHYAHLELQEHEQVVERERGVVAHAWQQCRSYFKAHAPQLQEDDADFFRNIAPSVELQKCDVRDMQKQQDALKNAIIKKVEHVRS